MMKFIVLILFCFLSAESIATDNFYTIVLHNHRFNPAKTIVPAGKKVKLLVINKDASIDEFHSDDLGVEKIISGKSKAVIFVGPLKPGSYSFMGEFNAKTAQGLIIAK
jgi:hypothetical protein